MLRQSLSGSRPSGFCGRWTGADWMRDPSNERRQVAAAAPSQSPEMRHKLLAGDRATKSATNCVCVSALNVRPAGPLSRMVKISLGGRARQMN